MSEGHDVVLREGDGKNPPELLEKMLRELAEQIAAGLPEAASAGRRWLRGKADQANAKAQRITSEIIAKITEAQAVSQKLVDQREAARRDYQVRFYQAQTERIRALIEAARIILELRAAGVEVDISVFLSRDLLYPEENVQVPPESGSPSPR